MACQIRSLLVVWGFRNSYHFEVGAERTAGKEFECDGTVQMTVLRVIHNTHTVALFT